MTVRGVSQPKLKCVENDDSFMSLLYVLQAEDCPIAMHTECAGLEKVPRGKWYCPHHVGQAKASKPRPSSAKPSGDLDSSLAPSTSGKGPAAGTSAPSRAGLNSKTGAGGKGKAKVQGEEETVDKEGSKKSGGKAGKKRPEAEPATLPPKISAKSAGKAQGAGGSKAAKAHSDDVPAAAPARKKSGSGDLAAAAKSSKDNSKSTKNTSKEGFKGQGEHSPTQNRACLRSLPVQLECEVAKVFTIRTHL